MSIAIQSTGTELLKGTILNTNAGFLCRRLAAAGLRPVLELTAGDHPAEITAALGDALRAADTVLITGGLGPTRDDLTLDAVSRFFGLELEIDPLLAEKVEQFWSRRHDGRRAPKTVLRQARVPHGATILPNANGSASGIRIATEYGGRMRRIFLLPGPPAELEPMAEESVIPAVAAYEAGAGHEYTQGFLAAGCGEYSVQLRLEKLLRDRPVELAYCARPEGTRVFISGSAPATVAAVGSMTIPILTTLGYDLTFSTAIVAVAGGLGVIIPPSIPFIMYGMASGASVSDLFLAGIVPGLMIGLLLMLYAIYHCRRYGEDKEKIHAEVKVLHDKGLLRVLKESFFALLSPVIILGCIYSGVASTTEAAVISVFYALIISLFVYRSIRIRDIWSILVEAIRTFTPILFILAASTAFSRVLTLMQVPQTVSEFILNNFHSPVAILLIINVFLLIVGMVMDTTPAILILTPILLPIVQAIGMDPIQFGVIMVVNLAIGFVTPPIGVNRFVASSLNEVPVMQIAKKAMPMIGFFLVALLLITFIPAISIGIL